MERGTEEKTNGSKEREEECVKEKERRNSGLSFQHGMLRGKGYLNGINRTWPVDTRMACSNGLFQMK